MRSAVAELLSGDFGLDLMPGGVAALFETAAWGAAAPDYLNSVVCFSARVPARCVLDALLAVERLLGRVRAERWASRSIDLDLLLYGDQVIVEPGLQVPHPRMHERRFVLEPLAEVAPNTVHPVLQASMSELALVASARFPDQRVTRIRGPEWADW